MKFELPILPYTKEAFADFITKEGFDYHYGKHHQTYVNNLNNLVKDTQWETKDLETIIKESHLQGQTALFNNAAQHFNHSFYWKCLTPKGESLPSGELLELINRDFGSFENFKTEFSSNATKLFGAGWTWLTINQEGKLEILSLKDADTPIILNKKPIITLDVWEHAYYIDHRNARPKFIEQFWNYVNWNFASENLK